MSLREQYRHKLNAQIARQRARAAGVKARARRMAADGKGVGRQELAKAEESLGQFASKLRKAAGAGFHALSEMRGGMGKALDDLSFSTKRAAACFGDARAASASNGAVGSHDAAPRSRRQHGTHARKTAAKARPARRRRRGAT